MSRSSTFSLLPVVLAAWCLVIAIVVPRQFEDMGWLLLLFPPAIVLSIITFVFFAFIFTPAEIAPTALCVSRFPRTVAVVMTAGCGYMTAWLFHGANEGGWSQKTTCVPGLVLLALARFIFSRFRYESDADS
jgi:ATP/ADP translocase